ncbi:MipA/OmpV family protein [Psychrobium sp. 1_MG-2023]|uniref:MipA/OmpV family protein n=1 Tax=Psychrobium sp. 1_MG-2023 TaxID=3062624 RepID=UPI000C345349|nr:MipA/OmpV family protein [Psychrobium sp. 1_MG-2023]MDP2561054.1 MipA/OmpV family protein [Psychrobium sp. 1_MG-2023]PKF58345.1 hypothetical protein CW748_04070 [Alteromonadales bacterium alter-6D02]
MYKQIIGCLIFLACSSVAAAECVEDSESCVTVGQWHLSVAAGYGELSNPLYGEEDIELYLLPSISYYGEKFYFDDGTLGYSFIELPDLTVSGIVNINNQSVFFRRWHPTNILQGNIMSSFSGDVGKLSADISKLPKRNIAVDGGIQLNYYFNNNWAFQSRLMHDISGVYKGFNAQLKVDKKIAVTDDKRWQIFLSLGGDWLSRKLVNYYYGLPSKRLELSQVYVGESSFNPFVSVMQSYKINEQWRVAMSMKYQYLNDGVTQSPLVRDNYTTIAFAGLVYDF